MRYYFLLIACLSAIGASYGQITFEQRTVLSDARSMSDFKSLDLADIDNDGDVDVLSASRRGLAIQRNMGGTTAFGEMELLPAESPLGFYFIIAGDIDNDGDEDILGSGGEQIFVLTNNGLGDFELSQSLAYGVGFSTNEPVLVLEDIDMDGNKDLIYWERLFSPSEAHLYWCKNDGNGVFQSPNLIYSGTQFFEDFYTEDLDMDGDFDLITFGGYSEEFTWFEHLDGAGTFGTAQNIPTGAIGPLKGVNSIDIDGDSDLDFISASGNGDISWYENLGGNTFGPIQVIADLNANLTAIRTEDLDNDGLLDLVIGSGSIESGVVGYLRNQGGMNFAPFQTISDFSLSVNELLVGDIDMDGNKDLIYGSEENNTILWISQSSPNTFAASVHIALGVCDADDMYASDIDGDGDLDLVSGISCNSQILWHENLNGFGEFGPPHIVENQRKNPVSVYTADIDGDMDQDIVTGFGGDLIASWYENLDGQGTFGAEQLIGTINNIKRVMAEDLDGDGDKDILVGAKDISDGNIFWYENVDGQGTFEYKQELEGDGSLTRTINVGDLDGDGDLDIIASNSFGVIWYQNVDGQGTFDSRVVIVTFLGGSGIYREVEAGDLDGDGDLDLVIGKSSTGSSLAWIENDGMANFGDPVIIESEFILPSVVHIADIDGDDDLDIIGSWFQERNVFYENLDGLGNFSLAQELDPDLEYSRSIITADLNGDTKADIILGNFYDLLWYEFDGLSSNVIKGRIQLDLQNDGCDETDASVPNILVSTSSISQDLATVSLVNGNYQLFPQTGIFTTSIAYNLPPFYTLVPEFVMDTFNTIGLTRVNDFCITPTESIEDLLVVIYPESDARPGFDAKYLIVYSNVGTVPMDGVIDFNFNGAKLDYVSASQIPDELSDNQLKFSFTDLLPFETRVIEVTLNVLPPPTVNIDEILNFEAFILPTDNDYNPNDNEFTLEQIVIGSYDPNDIRVLEGESIFYAERDDFLHYIIRFQNTGTASAINVRVENALDTHFDWTTFQLEHTSHPCEVAIVDGNQAIFRFDAINLADSLSDPAGSQGYIAYKIKPLSTVAIGDIFFNTAAIYFDFNPPIITNTVSTIITALNATINANELQFKAFPIPSTGILNIVANETISSIEVFDPMGKRLMIAKNTNQVYLGNLPQGIYFCKVTDRDGKSKTQRIVKQ